MDFQIITNSKVHLTIYEISSGNITMFREKGFYDEEAVNHADQSIAFWYNLIQNSRKEYETFHKVNGAF